MIGFASGEIPKPPLNLTLLKGCDIRGVYWGEFTVREPEAHRDNMSRLMKWAEDGVLSVHIHARYRLEDYQKAFEAIAKRQTLGKTLLEIKKRELRKFFKSLENYVAVHNMVRG